MLAAIPPRKKKPIARKYRLAAETCVSRDDLLKSARPRKTPEFIGNIHSPPCVKRKLSSESVRRKISRSLRLDAIRTKALPISSIISRRILFVVPQERRTCNERVFLITPFVSTRRHKCYAMQVVLGSRSIDVHYTCRLGGTPSLPPPP